MTRTACFSLLLAASLSGCFIVDSSLYENLPSSGTDLGVDAGPRDLGPEQDLGQVDGGGPQAADVCGDPSTPVLRDTTRGLFVDTTTATSTSVSPMCGGGAIGNDRFFAVDVTAGEYWHFHLAADPMFAPTETDRNPVVYVLGSDCNARPTSCGSVFADSCGGRSDEHFAFVAPASGRFYIGVDDASPGGGHYELNAFRPVCGNGTAEHGESCDDRDAGTCSASCRKIVGTTSEGAFPTEAEFNDNSVEANEVAFFETTSVQIDGFVGGIGDCYPDVFQVRALVANTRVVVSALTNTGTPCPGGGSALYSLRLLDATGTPRGATTDDANGCPHIDATLPMGVYFLDVRADDLGATAPAEYRLGITKTP